MKLHIAIGFIVALAFALASCHPLHVNWEPVVDMTRGRELYQQRAEAATVSDYLNTK